MSNNRNKSISPEIKSTVPVKIIVMTSEKKTKMRHISSKRTNWQLQGAEGEPAASGEGPVGSSGTMRPRFGPDQRWLSGHLRAARCLSHCWVYLGAHRVLPPPIGPICLPGLTSRSSPLDYTPPVPLRSVSFVSQLSDRGDMVPTCPVHPRNSALGHGEPTHNLLWMGKSQRNVPTLCLRALSCGTTTPELLGRKLSLLLPRFQNQDN